MNNPEKLHAFPYKFLEGPVSRDELQKPITEGNCRLAVQDYFLSQHGIFLGPQDVTPPEAFYGGGFTLIPLGGFGASSFDDLKRGDIVYAERFLDKKGRMIVHGFKGDRDRIRNLHMGVYVGILDEEMRQRIPNGDAFVTDARVIWHASYISGGTALWSVETFCQYYNPMIAKRFHEISKTNEGNPNGFPSV